MYVVAGLLVWPRSGDGGDGFGLLGDRGARLVWAALWAWSGCAVAVPVYATPDAISAAFAAAPAGAGWLSSLHSAVAVMFGGRV